MLSGEENFDQYFAAGDIKDEKAKKSLERFGIKDNETDRKWERVDDRFDCSKEPNELPSSSNFPGLTPTTP